MMDGADDPDNARLLALLRERGRPALLAELKALGVEYGQGFLLGKPVSFKLACELLREANGRPRAVP